MRARVAVATSVAALALLGMAACGFGVDLDGVFGGPASEGGISAEGSVDGGTDGPPEAGIPSIPLEQIGMGSNFACGRRSDGTVMCWGATDIGGELGDGRQIASSTPVLATGINDAADVSVGQHHVCVAHKSGTVSCWGYNEYRQLGDGTTTNSPTAKDVVALTDVTNVAVGYAHSCALKKDATVQCWGDNKAGQLGDGTVVPRSQPAPVTGLAGVKQIAASTSTTCALLTSGDVMCWGKNDVGQAGAPVQPAVQAAVKVAGLTGVTMIAAASQSEHFCAIAGTEVRCWGAGGNGQLGNAKGQDSPMPVTALAINDAIGVAAGGRHTCAWRKDGTVACWGLNNWRQLGLGETAATDDVSSPLPVNGLTNVKLVAGGASHTCALSTDGVHVSCWGTNVSGALGRGTAVTSAVPLKVAMPGTIGGFAMGLAHACAFDTMGALSCWGDNGLRQLGVDTFLATGTPAVVTSVSGVKHAAAGELHTCAVVAGGQVRCWGHGQSGELGNGMTPYLQLLPVTFNAGSATDVGAGYYFTCALLGTTDVTCAGRNDDVRLGAPGSNSSTPAIVPNLAMVDAGGSEAGPPPGGVTKLSVGRSHTCVIRAGGVVTCWGSNGGGECGAPPANATTPVDVALPNSATDVAAGDGHTCVLLVDGSVRCFGFNNYGQTTGGVPSGETLRTPDLGGMQAKAVIAGDNHSCAVLVDGTVRCWGRGKNGQLGNGVRADATTPVVVTNLATVKTLAARESRTCALLEDGSGRCWGNNADGELGDGTVMTTGTPGAVVGY